MPYLLRDVTNFYLVKDVFSVAKWIRVQDGSEEGLSGISKPVVWTLGFPNNSLLNTGLKRLVFTTKGVLVWVSKLLNFNPVQKWKIKR